VIKAEINQSLLKGGQRVPDKLVQKVMNVGARTLKVKDSLVVSVAFVNKQSIRRLNKQYRGKDKATDVLSFEHGEDGLLGEILICYDVASKQAQEKSVSTRAEVLLLITHGLLHLLGFDHKKKKEAEAMETLQKKILKRI